MKKMESKKVKQAYSVSKDLLRTAEEFFLMAKKLSGEENDNLYRYALLCYEYAQMAKDELVLIQETKEGM